jgi:hypothetical protein
MNGGDYQALVVQTTQGQRALADAYNEMTLFGPAPVGSKACLISDALSESTLADLRLQLLQSIGDQSEHEIWASVLAMQSAERFFSKLVTATWGLVTATVGLVVATIILVIVTLVHH